MLSLEALAAAKVTFIPAIDNSHSNPPGIVTANCSE